MGSCGLKKEKVKIQYIPVPNKLVYHKQVKLHIHMKAAPNFSKGIHTFKFSLDSPQHISSAALSLNGLSYYISSCVLPSTDPWGQFTKGCQDACFYQSDSSSLLAGVYDGHGKNGREVVKFCIDFIKADFAQKRAQCAQSPPIYLDKVTKQCDQKLKSQTEFDVSLSGTTQILVYIIDQVVYVANLGDSKAMLATKNTHDINQYELPEDRVNTIEKVRNKRMLPQTNLSVIKLTKQHTPSETTQKDRIFLCGGRVQRMTDQGKFIGPQRVWCQDANKPGLAMTRSIGDKIASGIGVISTPTIQSHQIDRQVDAFMVIATDGIWDVMELQQVSNFVQSFRGHCVNEPMVVQDEVRPSNSCIAHLLCEEARLRWLALVEHQNVMIDDISCTVIEFNKDSPSEPNRSMMRLSHSVIPQDPEEEDANFRSGTELDRNHFIMRDAFRASNVEEMSEDELKELQDFF